MADTLRAEFSDQLAEMSKQIDAMNGHVNDLDSRVNGLEGQLADHGSKLSALESRIAGMNAGADWKGVFRYRWHFDQQGDNDRFRQRVMFMLGYSKQVNCDTMFAFRLRTQTGNSPVSADFTLGSNAGGTSDIFLDRAYVKYSPSWFGYYTDADCNECTPKLDIYAGIYPNITYDPNEMILMDTVNLQGIGAVYHFNKDFQILTAMSVTVEENTGEFDDDAVLYATELRHTNFLTCGLDAWVGCYGWKNESALPASYFQDNMLQGFDFNNNGVIGDTGDRYSTNFNTVKAGLQYTFDCVWNKPLAVFGEYMINVDSDAEDRINLVNPFITPDIIYETTDDTGFVVGAQWGEKPECRGDWNWYARYKEIGANAVIDGLADAHTGGANTNSFEANWTYCWNENSLLGITYFLNKMNNAFGFGIPANKDDMTTVMVDWTFKF
jgi:hypothetical protein